MIKSGTIPPPGRVHYFVHSPSHSHSEHARVAEALSTSTVVQLIPQTMTEINIK